MAIILYDLAGADERVRFSPYCWRTKMALLHKDLAFETIPWRFTDKDVIASGKRSKVPVITDDGRWVTDSWSIALYLDETYPEHPLMEDETVRNLCHLINSWCDSSVNNVLRPLVLLKVLDAVHEKDKVYFRESRETQYGTTLEQICANQAQACTSVKETLAPAERSLSQMSYFGGEAPCYADYVLFGSLKWVHALSREMPVAKESAIHQWFDRMLDLFDGYARNATTAQG